MDSKHLANPPNLEGKANTWHSLADTSTPNSAGKKQEEKEFSNSTSKGPQLGVTLIRNVHSHCKDLVTAAIAA